MALHVALGAAGRVHLLQAPEGVAHAFDRFCPYGLDAARSHVLENDAQKIERIALDNIEFAIHEGFWTGEHGIEGDRAFCTRRLDDDMDRIAGSIAEFVGSAVGPGDGQVSGADQARDDALQQYVHGSYPIPAHDPENRTSIFRVMRS